MDALPPYAIYTVLAVSAFAFIVRLIGGIGQPKESNFKCAGCTKVTPHSARTIQVWRNGSTAFYCEACRDMWLQQRPERRRGRKGVAMYYAVVAAFMFVLPLASVIIESLAGGGAGINHALRAHRNRLENIAMLSDLFAGVVLVGALGLLGP